MKIALVVFLAISFFSHLSFAIEKGVKASVELFPMGSFEATSDKLIGKGKKTENGFTATEIKIPVSSFKTGISLRDKHMQERVQAKNNKFIIMKDVQARQGKGQALLTINEVTKPIKFQYKDLGKGLAEGHFAFSLKEFGIKDVSYQGVGVEDKIKVVAIVPYE